MDEVTPPIESGKPANEKPIPEILGLIANPKIGANALVSLQEALDHALVEQRPAIIIINSISEWTPFCATIYEAIKVIQARGVEVIIRVSGEIHEGGLYLLQAASPNQRVVTDDCFIYPQGRHIGFTPLQERDFDERYISQIKKLLPKDVNILNLLVRNGKPLSATRLIQLGLADRLLSDSLNNQAD